MCCVFVGVRSKSIAEETCNEENIFVVSLAWALTTRRGERLLGGSHGKLVRERCKFEY